MQCDTVGTLEAEAGEALQSEEETREEHWSGSLRQQRRETVRSSAGKAELDMTVGWGWGVGGEYMNFNKIMSSHKYNIICYNSVATYSPVLCLELR